MTLQSGARDITKWEVIYYKLGQSLLQSGQALSKSTAL